MALAKNFYFLPCHYLVLIGWLDFVLKVPLVKNLRGMIWAIFLLLHSYQSSQLKLFFPFPLTYPHIDFNYRGEEETACNFSLLFWSWGSKKECWWIKHFNQNHINTDQFFSPVGVQYRVNSIKSMKHLHWVFKQYKDSSAVALKLFFFNWNPFHQDLFCFIYICNVHWNQKTMLLTW